MQNSREVRPTVHPVFRVSVEPLPGPAETRESSPHKSEKNVSSDSHVIHAANTLPHPPIHTISMASRTAVAGKRQAVDGRRQIKASVVRVINTPCKLLSPCLKTVYWKLDG